MTDTTKHNILTYLMESYMDDKPDINVLRQLILEELLMEDNRK